jgi:DNA-binding transcriptional LysR family regulator
VGFALYRARRARPPTRAELRRAAFATFDESVGRLPHDEWLSTHAPQGRLVLRSNRQHTLIEAARLGLALSILPCLAADGDPTLARVLGPDRVFTRELWLLVHPDLQHAPRVRALLEAVAHHVARSAGAIAGDPGPRRSGVPASSSSKPTVRTGGS